MALTSTKVAPIFGSLLIFLQFVSITPRGVTVKASYDEQIINLIVWICPDPLLFEKVQIALQTYRTVDDINKSVQEQVSGYRNAIWLVNTINYSRTMAATDPGPNRSSQNLCFVQAPNERFVVFVAAVVP